MNATLPAAIFAYVLLLAISTVILRRAAGSLGEKDREQMAGLGVWTTVYLTLPVILLPLAWLIWALEQPGPSLAFGPAALGAALVLQSVGYVGAYRQYERLGLPAAFLGSFALSRALRLAGIMALYAGVLVSVREWLGASSQ